MGEPRAKPAYVTPTITVAHVPDLMRMIEQRTRESGMLLALLEKVPK